MGIERVSGGGDPRIAAYRSVADPELARAGGWFVAEGRLVVRRVIEDGRYRVRSLLLNDAAAAQLADVAAGLPSDVPIYVGATAAFAELTGFNIHRGCLALVDRPAPRGVEEAIAGASTILVLDGVANADNVGSAFRDAAAFDAGAVVLGPTCGDPWYRKAIRTSMGAVLRVPFAIAEPWPSALARVREAGFTIVALTPRQPSEEISAFAARGRPPRIAIVAGAEGAGLSAEVESLADVRVRIPIADTVDSLNVGVAIGIALYALSKVR